MSSLSAHPNTESEHQGQDTMHTDQNTLPVRNGRLGADVKYWPLRQ